MADPIASRWIGVNLMTVRPDLALVEALQVSLIRALERRGVGVLLLSLRHA
ncbi:MAG: hypothetical protein R3A51_18135 [Nannocystaceae bacterium]